jgi:hypothetical protein
MFKSMTSKFSSVCACGCLETIKRAESIIYDTSAKKAFKAAHAPKKAEEEQEARNVSAFIQAQEDLMFNSNNY